MDPYSSSYITYITHYSSCHVPFLTKGKFNAKLQVVLLELIAGCSLLVLEGEWGSGSL